MISNSARCSGVASDSRQDQTNGTLTIRPSAKCAVIISSSTDNSVIRGVELIAVLIPCLQKLAQICFDSAPNAFEFSRPKSIVACQANRLKPELACLLLSLNMDVFRLVAIEA